MNNRKFLCERMDLFHEHPFLCDEVQFFVNEDLPLPTSEASPNPLPKRGLKRARLNILLVSILLYC
jgi:hypothetical protein